VPPFLRPLPESLRADRPSGPSSPQLRSQVVHLLQVLRGGEEVVAVRSLGPHVQEDDELVLRTAQEAEELWRRARRAEREAAAHKSNPAPGPATNGGCALGGGYAAAAGERFPKGEHR
jgi:hypothetical protein